MDFKITKTLSERNQFLERLEIDLEKIFQTEDDEYKELANLENTVKHINELAEQPEHVALIPLAKNIYMNGKIIHTGEYMVEKKAYPESYSILRTLNQTIISLEDRISLQKETLEKITTAKQQLRERMNLLSGIETLKLDDNEDSIESEVTQDMPDKIESEKGAAVKVGEFYEILEFEDS